MCWGGRQFFFLEKHNLSLLYNGNQFETKLGKVRSGSPISGYSKEMSKSSTNVVVGK